MFLPLILKFLTQPISRPCGWHAIVFASQHTCNCSLSSFLMDSISGLMTGFSFSGRHRNIVTAPAIVAWVLQANTTTTVKLQFCDVRFYIFPDFMIKEQCWHLTSFTFPQIYVSPNLHFIFLSRYKRNYYHFTSTIFYFKRCKETPALSCSRPRIVLENRNTFA
jgi:hypothetical protein